ncbi:MAG: lipopolysaccharide assembly protein LapB [Oxalobacteraceae bacterium]|nr:lipopolysaccharide assembly protein LapB [Oxalobacteraceae bacterium]
MEFEAWWLVSIPFFFALGWIAARVDIRHLISESRRLPRSYYQGLNALLDEDPDKAIDAFVEIARLDPETAELHFALGKLFRRRGEIERAVRVHQNLLARADLSTEMSAKARFELGQDYLKAGLLDRAEETFHLLVGTSLAPQASRALLEIYQREKEWRRAIEAALALHASGSGAYQKEIAQFHCEIAQDELVHVNADAALATLDKALAYDRNNVRATLLSGDALLAKGDAEGALRTWRRVEQQSAAHVGLVAQRLLEGYRSVDRLREGLNLLRGYLAETPSIDLLEVVFRGVLELDGADAANQLVSDELRRTPTLLGLDKLIEARLMHAPPDRLAELSMVKSLVGGYAQKLGRYQCSHCGFKSRQFYWHCPGCSQWESYAPRRTEDLSVMGQA